MAQEPAEEKTLPASQKKLRDARRKAQVSHSKDFVSGFTFVTVLIYFLISWGTFRDHVLELMQVVAVSDTRPFEVTVQRGLELTRAVLLDITIPIVAIVVFTAVLAGMVATLGPVIAFDPIKPNADHINPAEGLKKIFSVKSFVEFAKNLFKLVVLGAAFFLIIRSWLQDLFEIPVCGSQCITPILIKMLQSLGAIAAIAFIIVGIVDLLLQRWLFLRDMRMTRTEYKREHKDSEGDPLIRAEQRSRRRQAMMAPPVKLGVRNAVCVVVAESGCAVGLRYNAQDSPVPVVVSKARGVAASGMIDQAKICDIPIIDNTALAESLYEQLRPGDRIREEHYSEVAGLMVRLGLV